MSGFLALPIGLILAGGQSRRLGGGDKTLLPLAGRSLLDRIMVRLRPQCGAVLLNVNGPAERFAGHGCRFVPDHAEDAGAGPLAGVLAGLDHVAVADPACPAVLTVSGDTPFLPPDLARRLSEASAAGAGGVAVACSGGRTHPLVALWPLAVREPLRRALRGQDRRRVLDVVTGLGLIPVDWPDSPVDPFFNINTPDDLAAAGRWARDSAA